MSDVQRYEPDIEDEYEWEGYEHPARAVMIPSDEGEYVKFEALAQAEEEIKRLSRINSGLVDDFNTLLVAQSHQRGIAES